MNYDESKLVPIAMGELEPEFEQDVPGSEEKKTKNKLQNRSIII